MNHNDLYLKMFRANYKKYLLLFACNAFLIAVCQFFASIVFNESFMDAGVIDPIISSNILLPTFVIVAFSIFFIPYTHISFNLQKEKEYGILETVGIVNKNIRNLIMFDNLVVASVALICGLLLGTALSLLFYKISITAMGINTLQITLNLTSYQVTIFFFLVIDLLTISAIAIRTSRLSIKQLLNDERKDRAGHSSNLAGFVAGVLILIIVASYLVTVFNQNDSNMLMLCFLVSAIGLLMIVSNSLCIIDFIKKRKPKAYYKNMVFLTGIRYKFSNNKKIFFFTICLMGIVIFFQVFAATGAKQLEKNEDTYYPYHIVYTEYANEQYPSANQIDTMAKNENVKLTMNAELKYFVEQNYTILSSSDAKQLLGKNYEIQQGTCIVFSQYDIKDGYPHYGKPSKAPLKINSPNFKPQYTVKEIKDEVLVNDLALETEYCVLINDQDFNQLVKHEDNLTAGKLRIIQCSTLSQSEKLCKAIEKTMRAGTPDQEYVEIFAKYKAVKEDKQASTFLAFVFTTMDLLLYLSNNMMLHFKFLSGMHLDKEKYGSMWKVGFSSDEIHHIVKKDIRVMMVLPAAIAVLFGGSYAFSLLRLSEMEGFTWTCILIVGGIVLLLQNILSIIYAKYYMNKLQ